MLRGVWKIFGSGIFSLITLGLAPITAQAYAPAANQGAEQSDLNRRISPWLDPNFPLQPNLKISRIEGENLAWTGGETGWELGPSMNVGVAGYQTLNQVRPTNLPVATSLGFGYGGATWHYLWDYPPYHLGLGILLGAGAVNYYPLFNLTQRIRSTGYFIVYEPDLSLLLDITKRFQIGVGVSYRLSSDIGIAGLSGGNVNLLGKLRLF